MRRADAVCAQYGSPNGVTLRFHVCAYSIEPTFANRACNLLPKHCDGSAIGDEPMESGPQVPLISKPNSFARRAERLAGARATPYWARIGPSRKSESVTPSSDTGKEMALGIFGEISWLNIFNVPSINITFSYMSHNDKYLEPFGRKRIMLVVISASHFRRFISSR